jgi:hypothetical protein
MAKRKRTNNDLQNITEKDRQYNGQQICLSFCVVFCRSLFVLYLLTIELSAGSLQLTTNPTGDACATADTADGGPGKMLVVPDKIKIKNILQY